MADDVLKSFLVAIGYKEDAASRKKMTDGLAKVEKAVASLSLALVAATTAATAAAVKMAASFEDLFYASQRTGASINNLRGLAYAVSQLGGSYGGAVQSLEAFAKNIRTNPGYESMARKLGVATRENGKLRDTVDILTDLGRVFKGQRYEIAYQYAQALGLDEKTFQLLRDQPDALRRYRDEYERTTKALGTNTKEMTEQGKALSQSWRSFLSVMEALSERIAATFFPIITKLLDYMREWVVTHGPQINAFWTQVGQGIEVVERAAKSAYDTVEPFVTLIAKKLSEGYNATGGAAETLKEMKQLFSDIGDMVKRAYEYIVKLIQLVGLDKVAAALGAGIKGGFRLEDYTGPGGMPDLSGGGVPGAGGGAGGAGGIPPGATGKGALAPFKRGFFGRLKDAVVGPRPSIRKGYQAGGAGGDGAGGVVDAGRFTALKNLIQGKESGSRSYTSVYGNGRYGEPPKPITEMTVEEVLEWQRQMKAKVGSPAFPVGRAQFVESTLRRLATKTGTLKEKLSPALQERFFDMLIQGRGRSVSGLRAEWEGLNRVSPDEILRAYDKEGPTATSQSPKEGRLPNGRPIGQATNVSDEEVIANDHGHWNRVTKALGNMDFAKRHGASDAPLGVTNTDNSSSKSLVFSPKTEINVMGGSDPQATANQTVGALTRFQELSLRNAQGAIR